MNPSNLLLQFISCIALFSLTIFSNQAAAQCVAEITLAGQDTVCIGASVFLSNPTSSSPNGIGAWDWTVNGSPLSSTVGSATFEAIDEGIYEIILEAFDTQFACSDKDTVVIVVLGNPSPDVDVEHISCNGLCDGTALVSYGSPNAGAYTATWSIGGTAPLAALCAGLYEATVSDNFGCSVSLAPVQGEVIEPDVLTSNISNGATVVGCPGDPDIQLNVGVSGGTPNGNGTYEVLWSPADSISNVFSMSPLLTPGTGSIFQTYTANITDDRGCTTNSDIQLLPSNSTVKGVISIDGSVCANCEVAVLKPQATQWTRLFTGVTDAGGNYLFGNVPGQSEIYLMADPDDDFHPAVLQGYYTASAPTHLWSQATAINSGCGTTLTKNIDLPAATQHNGQCTLRGALYQIVPGKAQTEEDPIPLIDVVVEKTPPGSPQGKATTDINGEFEFSFMEFSDTLFALYVNIPGLPMNQTHQILIDPGDILYDQLDLCVNLEGTFISTCTALSVDEPTEDQSAISVYPNPSNGSFQLVTGSFEGEEILVSIFDVSGRAVLNQSFQNTAKELQFSGLNQGYYLIRIEGGKKAESIPLSVLNF